MSNDVSKKDYLKRYLENDKDSERKRKKKAKLIKPKANVSRLKIIHEDIDLKSINFGDEVEKDDDEEAPIIAEVIDERPLEEKLKELYESSRWKKVNNDETSQSSPTVLSVSDSRSGVESFKNHISTERNESVNSVQTSLRKARHDSDGDISPPRNQKRNTRRHDSDGDISPPRNQERNTKRHDSDGDISPPRNQERNTRRHDSDGDISPPRNQKRNTRRHDSDNDISPLRNQKRHSASNISPQQSHKQNKHDSDSDISLPRHQSSSKLTAQSRNKFKKWDSDSDISPPRHKIEHKSNRQVKNLSKRNDSDTDVSPPRHKANKSDSHMKKSSKRNDSDSDEKLSHHQIQSSRMHKSNKSRSRWNSDSDISPPRSSSELSSIKGKDKKHSKTLSGLKAGLQNSETLQQEVQELRKREKIQLNMLDDEISGRNADTVIRDRKTGMKRDLNKEQEAKAEENKRASEYQQKYNKWGKGIEQTEDKVEKFKDDLYEMSKPLARYQDDEDLDERLKSVMRHGDPMSEYMMKKRKKNVPDDGVPVYSGPPAPPNRFGILPGYRWDGVDRSNGFESKYFEKINNTKAVRDEAYLWSVQDM